MSLAAETVWSGPPREAHQCPPNTAVVFDPTETLISQRWDARRAANAFIARPEAAGDYAQWEVDAWIADAPSLAPPARVSDRDHPPTAAAAAAASLDRLASLDPPDWPTDRAETAYESWRTIDGDVVHRVKRHGPGVAPPEIAHALYARPGGAADKPSRANGTGAIHETRDGRIRLVTTEGAKTLGDAGARQVHAPLDATTFAARRVPLRGPAAETFGGSAFGSDAASNPSRATSLRAASVFRGPGSTFPAEASSRDPFPTLTHGRAPFAADWRAPHFAAPSRDAATGEPAEAVRFADDAPDAGASSRREKRRPRHHPRYGVAADRSEGFGSASQPRSRSGAPPSPGAPRSARSTFRRVELPKVTDAASFYASERADALAGGSLPRPRWDHSSAIAAGGRNTISNTARMQLAASRPHSARPAEAKSLSRRPGDGRGGGGVPTLGSGEPPAAAARGRGATTGARRRLRAASAREYASGEYIYARASTAASSASTAAGVPRSEAEGPGRAGGMTTKKSVAFPDTDAGRARTAARALAAAEAAGGAGAGAGAAAWSDEGEEEEEAEGEEEDGGFGGFGRGTRGAAAVPTSAQVERLAALGASFDARRRTMVARGMDQAKERIRNERSWGG